MIYDEWGEVINSEHTFEVIADILKVNGSTMIGWSDGHGTHFDILFTYRIFSAYGSQFQGGIRPATDLFVSIMRWGAFGFEVKNEELSWEYIQEKLGSRGVFGPTTGAILGELINGVRKQLV